ncbi:MAG: enoyl-CoA hydratase/isomerase family protein [Candidatus Acidiferrales bacterium]
MSLALACDLRIASERASFKQAFSRIGLYPDFGATFFLPRLVGLARASELFHTAEQISAAEACRIGIVCRLCPHDRFEQDAQELAQAVAAGPPMAFRDVKRTMIGDAHRQLEEALDEENAFRCIASFRRIAPKGLLHFSRSVRRIFRDARHVWCSRLYAVDSRHSFQAFMPCNSPRALVKS